jgi:hypothetical protein
MRYAIPILWLIVAVSEAQAIPITYDFAGTTGVGAISGQFTVDTDVVVGTNVRNLVTNTAYQVSSWSFTADSNVSFLPTTTFSNNFLGDSFEYCVGKCIFASGSVTTLRMRSHIGTELQLAFTPEFYSNGSHFRVIDGGLAIVQTGLLTGGAVPEPNTLSLLFSALALLLAGFQLLAQDRLIA